MAAPIQPCTANACWIAAQGAQHCIRDRVTNTCMKCFWPSVWMTSVARLLCASHHVLTVRLNCGAGTDAAAFAAADVRYSPIEDYNDYGGTASQPPGLGTSSTPADYAGQPIAPPPWHSDSAHPVEVWQQPRGASPPTNGGVAPHEAHPQWHQQMHAAHSDLRAMEVGPQSGYATAGQQVPLAVAAQQAAGHYAHHQLAMSHMGHHRPPAHQLPPQPAYAMQTQPGYMPGQLHAFTQQPEDLMHPAQRSAQQPPPYGAAQFQPGPGLPQQSGYGPPPSQHNRWQPEFGRPGAYAHHVGAPPVASGYAPGLQRPPTLPPPQEQPCVHGGIAHQQPLQPQWEAPGPTAPGAGYFAPQLDGYGKQDILGLLLSTRIVVSRSVTSEFVVSVLVHAPRQSATRVGHREGVITYDLCKPAQISVRWAVQAISILTPRRRRLGRERMARKRRRRCRQRRTRRMRHHRCRMSRPRCPWSRPLTACRGRWTGTCRRCRRLNRCN